MFSRRYILKKSTYYSISKMSNSRLQNDSRDGSLFFQKKCFEDHKFLSNSVSPFAGIDLYTIKFLETENRWKNHTHEVLLSIVCPSSSFHQPMRMRLWSKGANQKTNWNKRFIFCKFMLIMNYVTHKVKQCTVFLKTGSSDRNTLFF